MARQNTSIYNIEPIGHVSAEPQLATYILRLYVAGTNSASARAVANIKNICEDYLKDRYTLEVIDLYQQPALAKEKQIIAIPTLDKELPLPHRRIIGDLADKRRVLVGIDLYQR